MSSASARTYAHEPVPGGPVHRVVVPVGGTDREYLAQEQAVWFADALGVPVTAVHVSTAPDDVLPDTFHYLETQCRRRNVDVQCLKLAGTSAVEAILPELDAMDLVIVGSEKLADRHQFDSLAGELLKRAPGPVQVVRLGRVDLA